MKIDEEIKTKWVAALRSGEYKQGRGFLRKIDSKGVDRFCCLGVLCDIYTKENSNAPEWKAPHTYLGEEDYEFDHVTSMPSRIVNKWVGLGDEDWEDIKIKTSTRIGSLNVLNDTGSPFKKIADYIEAQL